MSIEYAANGIPRFNLITLGEDVCNLIKKVYFAQTKWIDCYQQVADKFTELKRIIRISGVAKNEHEIISILRGFSETDLLDALGDQGAINAKASGC